MDVLNTFNKVFSSVSTTVSQLSNHLPGNPLTREYEVENQICSAGIGKKKILIIPKMHTLLITFMFNRTALACL